MKDIPGIAITRGIVAEIDISTQLSVASRKPSRGFSSRLCLRVASEMSSPIPELAAAAMRNVIALPSRVIRDVRTGKVYAAPKNANSVPRT